MPKKTDKEKLDLACSLYESGSRIEEVQQKSSVSRPVIYRELRKRGINSHNGRIYSCDHNSFDIPSADRDYWVGMMMADGCVSLQGLNSYRIKLNLMNSDIEHLHKFKKFLKANNPIYEICTDNIQRATLSICSKRLFDSLSKFGVIPRKTKIAKVHFLQKSKDFWRGVIDGDGCLQFRNSKPSISIAGSQNLTLQYINFIKSFLPYCKVNPYLINQTFCVDLRGNNAYQVIKYLYKDCSVALNRKNETAKNIINNYNWFDENPNAKKATTSDVIKMRKIFAKGNHSIKEISQIFNLSYFHTRRILKRITWKHI